MDVIATMLITVVEAVASIIQILVIASIIVSIVGADPYNPLVRMINQTTEPMYRPIRKFTANLPGAFDWSPLVLLILVITIKSGLVVLLKKMAV